MADSNRSSAPAGFRNGATTADVYEFGEGEDLVGGVARRGTWKHAAFHVATTIATPAAYAPLPFAVASLGWSFGVSSLVSATLATWYSSLLIASLWGWNGKKQTTYRDLAGSIYGRKGYWAITFFQQIASLGNNIAIQIAAGTSLKAVYKHYKDDGGLTLQHFILLFGVFELCLSQLPDIHSLRWVNALCTFSTIGFAGTTIGVTIYNGKNVNRNSISYSLQGSSSDKIFKAFNALGVIAFSFGDAMLPEIQNTVKEPTKRNMYKGVSASYSIIVCTYWQLAFLGYWAFGSQVQTYIVASLTTPKWTIVMANIFAVIQIAGCYQIYCRPTYAYIVEITKSSKTQIPHQEVLTRFIFTSIYMSIITLIAAAMPFFGDFVSICGAIGFTPLDFVFPVLAYLKAGRKPRNLKLQQFMKFLNMGIAAWFSIVAVLGCIGAVKFIIDDVKTYRFFHDMKNCMEKMVNHQMWQEPYNNGKNDIESGNSNQLYPMMLESPQIRWAFIRKVYIIISIQLLLTAAVASVVVFYRPISVFIVTTNAGFLVYIAIILVTLITLCPLQYYHQKHPVNFILLGIFTTSMAFLIGLSCAFTKGKIILEAAILTGVVVGSLTLYTFWAAKKGHDFSFLGPFLFAAILVLMVFSFIQILFPLGKLSVMIYGGLAAIVFSGFIVYDTDNLIKRFSYDEYIWAAVTLYLDIINLFLALLTLFSDD